MNPAHHPGGGVPVQDLDANRHQIFHVPLREQLDAGSRGGSSASVVILAALFSSCSSVNRAMCSAPGRMPARTPVPEALGRCRDPHPIFFSPGAPLASAEAILNTRAASAES